MRQKPFTLIINQEIFQEYTTVYSNVMLSEATDVVLTSDHFWIMTKIPPKIKIVLHKFRKIISIFTAINFKEYSIS